MSKWVVMVVAAIAVTFAGCDDPGDAGSAPPEDPPSLAEPGPTRANAPLEAEPDCPREEKVVAQQTADTQGAKFGDLDGDGTDDEFTIAIDRRGPFGCHAYLVAEVGQAIYSVPIWRQGETGGLPAPALQATAEINGLPGDEIVVSEAGGASTQFFAVYTLVDGDFQMMQVDGIESTLSGDLNGLFAYGGSVGHLEAVDCTPDGRVVITLATPAAGDTGGKQGIYEIERRFFRPDGAVLRYVDTETHEKRFSVDVFPEFSTTPFGHCT